MVSVPVGLCRVMLPANDLFVDATELLPGLALTVRNPLVHMNAEAAGDAAFARRLHYWFAARDVEQPPVRLGRYPRGTCLDGATYRVLLRGVPDEAELPGLGEAALRNLARRVAEALTVDVPCLLVCRTGEWCWGHWLLDMLPKIVLAERCFPGRFCYAVPAGIIDPADRPAHAPGYAGSVLGSLAAYGIGPARLLPVRHDTAYRFAGLLDMDGVSGKHMHPGLLAMMRDLPAVRQGGARAGLTAVLRAPPSMRPIANPGEIRGCLDRAGAGYLDPLQADFAGQVAAFARSDVIVGDLGSNLAGMIYARPGAGLMTLAPLRWDDEYFAKLFQRLDLVVADVRGFSAAEDEAAIAAEPYYVSPRAVLGGLEALRAGTPGGAARVGGRLVARAPGTVVLQVDFAIDGNAAGYLREGFANAEARGTWSVGSGCRLVLPRPEELRGGLWIEVVGAGFVRRPHLVSRPLRLSVNGVGLLDVAIDDATILHMQVTANVSCLAEELELVFSHPCCPSPEALGVSGDKRSLGFMFQMVRLRHLSGDQE